MQNTLVAILVFFVSLFAYTKFAGPIQLSVNSTTFAKSDAFSVTGEGKVTTVPDLAVINVGVTSQTTTVKAAKEQLDSRINAVAAAVKKLGVDARDIQTTNYSVSPQYDFREGQRITGYQASANLTIKIRNLERANDVIDAAATAGANQIGGLSFEIADKTKVENEARQKAVAQARQKAEDAAKIAGFTLGKVVNYSENFGGFPQPLYATKTAIGGEAPPERTQLEPGQNEIVVLVSLSYEIR